MTRPNLWRIAAAAVWAGLFFWSVWMVASALAPALHYGTGPNCPDRDPAHLGVCWPINEVTK